MPQTFYEVVWIFLLYAFLGWCTEVSYATLDTGKFINRGFLNGPYCPVYGLGVLIVVSVLTPIKDNLLLLFFGSLLLTSILEYLTGYILEKIFHNKWWDYSDKPYNIKGYICLKFSILWGLACCFIMLIIHPMMMGFIHIIPKILGVVLLFCIMTGFCMDCIFTVSTILNFNKRLRIMAEVAEKLKIISDDIGENIYENVTEAIEKKEQLEERHEEIQKEYEELSKRYKELIEKKIYGHTRLIRAFPHMKSLDYEDALIKLRESLKKVKKVIDKSHKI